MANDRYDKLDWSDLELGVEELLKTILQEARELRERVDDLANKQKHSALPMDFSLPSGYTEFNPKDPETHSHAAE